MSISSSANSARLHFTATSGQTAFSVSFEFFDNADLDVYVNGTQKTITTHYSVSGGDGSTGTVTFNSGLTLNDAVTITRRIDIERVTDFSAGQAINRAALNTQLDTLTAISSDNKDRAERSLRAPDDENAPTMTLPSLTSRKGTVLGFNATSGNVEAGPKIADVSTLAAVTADIATLADIEDGTDATDAIQTVAGIASNVSTVAGVSSAVSTVAGISSNVTAVAADATDIGVVAGKAAEIGRLGTSDAVADLAILGTSDAVSDMNTLAAISSNISTVAGISANVTSVAGVASLITSDFVADINTLATSDIVSDLNTLATADIVSDLNTLATSDIVSDLNTLATADIVSDLNTLATTDIVSDLNTLATTDIVTDLNLLATSAIVEDLNLLATSTVIADMATLAGAGANPNISSLGVSGNITLADNGKAIFGAGSDLQIYHNGSNSYISEGGTGNLYIEADNQLILRSASGEVYGKFERDSAATFYHNNAAKLATTSTGVDITGVLSSDGLTSSAVITAQEGRSNTAGTGQIVIDPDDTTVSAAFRLDQTDNKLNIDMTNGGAWQKKLSVYTGGDISFYEDTGTTAKFFWDASAESLGIGTTSPTNLLHLKDEGYQLLLEDTSSGNTGEILVSDTSLYFFSDRSNSETNSDIRFSIDGSERMRIDSSGHLLVGKTTIATGTAGIALRSNGEVRGTADGDYAARFSRLSSDGAIVGFEKDGTTVGSIGTNGGRLSIGSGDVNLNFNASANSMYPISDTSGTLSDGVIDVGASTARFKDLYLSGGVKWTEGQVEINSGRLLQRSTGDASGLRFDGSGYTPFKNGSVADGTVDLGYSAGRYNNLYLAGGVYLGGVVGSNKLEDYEEGSWTPTQGNFSTWSSPTFDARYTKVGRMVFINLRQTGGTIGWSAQQQMGGLPFAPSQGASAYATDDGPSSDNGALLIWTANNVYFQKGNASETALVFSAMYYTSA